MSDITARFVQKICMHVTSGGIIWAAGVTCNAFEKVLGQAQFALCTFMQHA